MTQNTPSWYVGMGARNELFNLASVYQLMIDAGNGNDVVYLFYNFGDIIRGGLGNDVLVSANTGFVNSDGFGQTIYGDNDADPYDAVGGADQIGGGDSADSIFGGGGGDFIDADRGNDLADGGAGDDIMWGGLGADTLLGGLGNDTIWGGGDAYYPTMPDIFVDYDGRDDSELAPDDDQRGPWGIAGGQANSEFADGADDRLDGGDGDDQLYGQAGVDTLTGGNGFDYLYGGDGNDSLDGNDGNDQLYGDAGYDTMVGGLAGDNLFGGADGDTLDGGDGNDNLDGGSEDDTLYGGAGFDSLVGGDGLDGIDGGSGIDTLDYYYTNLNLVLTLAGPAATIVKVGGVGEDTIQNIENVNGGQGNDRLTGDGGANTLYGDSGSDTLRGGGGADDLDGGLGPDAFVYGAVADSTGAAHDILTAYDARSEHFVFPVAVAAVDAKITGGHLSDATFNSDLRHAVTAAKLGAGNAVLFKPTTGDHHGETFLIVDANGIAGYQSGRDYVIHLNGATHLTQFDAGDFTTPGAAPPVLVVHPDGSAGVQTGGAHHTLGDMHGHTDAFASLS